MLKLYWANKQPCKNRKQDRAGPDGSHVFLDIIILQRTVENVMTKAGSRVVRNLSRGVASGLHLVLALSLSFPSFSCAEK